MVIMFRVFVMLVMFFMVMFFMVMFFMRGRDLIKVYQN